MSAYYVLELELDDDDSSEDEGDYEEPEESGRKRKLKPLRGAPKKNKKTACNAEEASGGVKKAHGGAEAHSVAEGTKSRIEVGQSGRERRED
jgi:hypothetical protein